MRRLLKRRRPIWPGCGITMGQIRNQGLIVFDASGYRLLHEIILSISGRSSCIKPVGWSEAKTRSWISPGVGSELRQQLPKSGGLDLIVRLCPTGPGREGSVALVRIALASG